MVPCPVCGRMLCDHTPAERGQTYEQIQEDLNNFKGSEQSQNTDQ